MKNRMLISRACCSYNMRRAPYHRQFSTTTIRKPKERPANHQQKSKETRKRSHSTRRVEHMEAIPTNSTQRHRRNSKSTWRSPSQVCPFRGQRAQRWRRGQMHHLWPHRRYVTRKRMSRMLRIHAPRHRRYEP